MLLAVCHSTKAGWSKVDDLSTLSELRKESGNLLWAEADVEDLDDTDIATIADEFDLHELAVEDAGAPRQRAKLDVYENHLFLVVHQLDEEDGQLEPSQLSFFVGERYVLTIHHGARRTIEEAKKRWRGTDITDEHPFELLHTLLDVIVDDHQKHAGRIELEVEQLEDIALSDIQTPPIQRQLYSVKQRVARLRRYALPVQRILDDLLGSERGMQEELKPKFRDVRDHMVRMGEQIKNIDELSQAVLDLVRSEQAEALNQNSQKLAAWAAIFAVSTVVAGIYGMNFELIPEENSLVGFWFALVVMFALAAGLYTFFKRKGWL